MIKFYSNENFPFPAVEALRNLGYDILTTLDTGMAGKSITDEEVLAWAHAENRAVITLNRKHFIRLHEKNKNHSGIIVCNFDNDFMALANRIDQSVKSFNSLYSELIRVNR